MILGIGDIDDKNLEKIKKLLAIENNLKTLQSGLRKIEDIKYFFI